MNQVTPAALEAQLQLLGTLVELGKRTRDAATPAELGFIIVNESHRLVPYRQAALWLRDGKGRGRIVAVSGSPTVERGAPFTAWLNQVFARLDMSIGTAAVRPVSSIDLKGSIGDEWQEWLPADGLWVPLVRRADRPVGVILFARDKPWTEGEQHLLGELSGSYAHAIAAFRGGRRRSLVSGRWWHTSLVKLALAAGLVGALCLPIPLSALAPAEVVALAPTIVRAPLDGVIDHFAVQPNAPVSVDQRLLELDPRTIENKLEVADKALAVAESEYRQAAQSALFDDKSRSQLAVLKAKMDQRRADVAYSKSLLDRIHVTASRSGIAVFDDPNDWIGRPVTIGERLMEIADPGQVELEIWLPVADAITLKPGAEVEFFLNVSPGEPLRATLRQASYEATMSPGNLLGYRLKASLAPTAKVPRIGLRGTAKVYGETVSLFYYLARRPLASARQLFGF
ncbi:HlyD family efflux transporter periplasmic adaptor subunit [Telmatospirillum sp.]|uniref:efflux RND transporter periplasmic adaptor subunit n=1 Tax=Telmatospirillum sp. TaxID=2079197 RepID=UPI00283C3BAE|nr:HlyD family efflux transporter periplasmic adaptor subunit [Telmatospirillum sp.]MDR3440648.1 HlyD family efflux transporter periplasmic adaptor subunit [Telmatospirillum sp.]